MGLPALGRLGAHAIVHGAYEVGSLEEVVSLGQRIEASADFRRHELEEAWVVMWPWNLDHPAFQMGIDLTALKAAYKALTGRDLPAL